MKKTSFLLAEIHDFTSEEAQQLLHNKFVVVIGDSNYRAIYKDLVYFLQTDEFIPTAKLKDKHEDNFFNDCLVELNKSQSRNDYHLVRQYRTPHHLVRFYFITRAYSSYMESILNDLRAALEADLVPDVVILHSCLWDLNRYHDAFSTEPPVAKAIREYRQNVEKLFQALDEVLPSGTLIIWSTAMAITKDARGYVIEQPCKVSAQDMIEANFYSSNLARRFWFDVLDLHYYFRFLQDFHSPDGIHWNFRAHRYLTKLLLTHLAEAWQVQLQKQRPLMDPEFPGCRKPRPSFEMLHLNSQDVRQLLHNKFVVILGDSIQRSVYKDLIQLLQSDSLLTTSQMKSKGEYTFENDHLIEGGVLDGLHNGIGYREVRQYRTRYHLVRFYFLTRIHSKYFESILEDFRVGLQPDVLILNSCVWDVSRYGSSSMKEYRKNLEIAFNRLDADLPPSCLVIWNMTMPLGPSIKGGFLIPELQHLSQTLRQDIIEGNFYGATLANLHLFDVVDLHFHFRFDLGNRVKDGIHWNNVVHRRITNLLLTHLADAWGVVIPKKNPCGGQVTFADRFEADWHYPRHPSFCDDFLFVPNDEGSPMPFSGFFSFEEPQGLPFCPDNVFRDVALDNFHCHPWDPPQPFLPYPSHNEENIIPRSRRHRRRKHAGTPFVMRQGPSYRRDVSPYRKRKVPFNRH